MKRMLVAVILGLFCFGCSGDDSSGSVCDEALSKTKQCGITPDNEDTSNCSGAKECSAKCTKDASCDDLKNLGGNLIQCLSACAK